MISITKRSQSVDMIRRKSRIIIMNTMKELNNANEILKSEDTDINVINDIAERFYKQKEGIKQEQDREEWDSSGSFFLGTFFQKLEFYNLKLNFYN